MSDTLQRFTGVCSPHERGGFVAYADHLAALTVERERADRAEAALRELGRHPESCGDDCVSELARQDVMAERDALRERVARLVGEIEAALDNGCFPAATSILRTALEDK